MVQLHTTGQAALSQLSQLSNDKLVELEIRSVQATGRSNDNYKPLWGRAALFQACQVDFLTSTCMQWLSIPDGCNQKEAITERSKSPVWWHTVAPEHQDMQTTCSELIRFVY